MELRSVRKAAETAVICAVAVAVICLVAELAVSYDRARQPGRTPSPMMISGKISLVLDDGSGHRQVIPLEQIRGPGRFMAGDMMYCYYKTPAHTMQLWGICPAVPAGQKPQ